ncbi:copper chaperone PCu(A)C [Gammaproteobacteria bacterium AB-CW1]|uniref:Copper chaperone PCu(A)C n=1 Tax=Natronospira elongata TaxID=3110268 RepID=A0AAP6JD73_9GAMM|nr:copper chaperone PCu(A)C [Gammaproteobacteria bacterium AB-CW1]
MRTLFLALGLLTLSLAVQAAPPVTAESPWVREAPPGSSVTAAYLDLVNQGDETITLVNVRSEEFRRAEIHETIHEDGQAKMRAVDEIAVPAEGRVELKPGGKHLMLHEPREELSVGDWAHLVLEFDNGQLLELAVPVKRRTGRDDDDDHHDHHEHRGHH